MKAFYFLFLLLNISMLRAQKPGTVDQTYGDNRSGTATITDRYGSGCLAIQKDDKILTGSLDFRAEESTTNTLTRRNNDGTLDTTFGTGGVVYTDVSDLRPNFIWTYGWNRIAVAADGKIIAAGALSWNNPNPPPGGDFLGDDDIVLARFLPDGRVDSSFGKGGRVVTNLGYLEAPADIALQTDGKILVAGSEIRDIYYNTKGMMIVRYNADGTLDKQFGEQKGYTLYNKTYGDYGAQVELQADGKMVVGGIEAGDESFIFVRFLANGRVDSSYGINGFVETKFATLGGSTEMLDMVLDGKGRIVATGSLGSYEGTAVTRYLPNGNLDSTFDTDGKLELYFDNFPFITPNTLLVQPNGKLVINGYTLRKGDKYYKKALIGLNENASRDASFGNANGITKTGFLTYGESSPGAVMQSDGKILMLNTQIDEFPYDSLITLYITRFNGYPGFSSLLNDKTGTEMIPFANAMSALKIYPNPATDYCMVSGLKGNATLTITNASGAIAGVYRTSNSTQYKLSTDALAAGVYYVQASANGNTETVKFIKE